MTDFVRAGLVIGGNLLGGAIGGTLLGGPIGGLAGGLLGAALFPQKLPTQKGPRIGDQPLTTSAYGAMIPEVWGTVPVKGNIIDAGGYRLQTNRRNVGGKGGPSQEVVSYNETQSYCVLLSRECDGIVKITINGELVYDASPGATAERPEWLEFVFYDGSDTQGPSSTFEAIHGAAEVPAYRGVARVEFPNLPITRFKTGALQFDFVVSSNVSSSQSNTTYTHTGENTYDLRWHRDLDLIIATCNYNQDVGGDPKTLAIAIDPYSQNIVWRHINDDPTDVYQANWTMFGSVPRFENGFPAYQANEFVFIPHQDRVDGNINQRDMSVLYAESGKLYQRVSILDDDQTYVWVSCYEDDAVFYHQNVLGATSTLIRGVVTIGSFSSVSVALPSGYEAAQAGALCAKVGNNALGEDSYIVAAIRDTATGNQYGVCVAKDELPGLGGTALNLDWNIGFFPSSAAQMLDGIWDPINEQFWIVEQFGTTPVRARFYTLQTDGTISSPIDWNTEFSITGEPGQGGGISDINRILDINPATGLIYVVIAGTLYSFPVTDSTETPTQVGTGTEGSPIAWHNGTGSLFTGDETAEDGPIVNQRKMGRASGGTATLQSVCEDISDGVGLVSADYDYSALSAIAVKGFRVANVAAASDLLDTLREIYQFDVVSVDGVLTAKLRSTQTSAATLDEDDIGAHAQGTQQPIPISITKSSADQLPRTFEVEFLDEDHNFESGWQRETRLASSAGTTIQRQYAVVLDNDDAKEIASINLHQAHIEAEQYSFNALITSWEDLQPGNVVTVTYDGATYLMKVVESPLRDGGIVAVNAVRSDTSIFTDYSVGGVPRTHTNAVQGVGRTILTLLDIPALRSPDNDAGIYVVGYSYTPGWRGAEVFSSSDANNYSKRLFLNQEAELGFATDSLGAFEPGLIDSASLTVDVVNGTFSSLTTTQTLTDSTLGYYAYGQPGRFEIVRAIDVATNADGTVTLSNFYRGLRGTGQFTDDHETGDVVIYIDQDTMSRLFIENADIGSTLYLKAATVDTSLDNAPFKTVTAQGRALLPYPVANIDVQPDGSSGWDIDWHRQDRKKARFMQQPEMSESTELYNITIFAADGETVVRTDTATSETYNYASADVTSDFGGSIDFLKGSVSQVSSVVGEGPVTTFSAGNYVSDYDGEVTGRGTLIDFWAFDESSGATVGSDSGSNDMTCAGTYTRNSDALLLDSAASTKFASSGLASVSYWAGINSAKSVEFWIKLDTWPPFTESPIVNLGLNDGWFVTMGTSSTRDFNFYGYSSGTQRIKVSTGSVISLDTVYHVVINFDHPSSSSIEIFVNGISEATGTVGTAWARQTSGSMIVGADNVSWTNSTSNLFWISKLTFYDTALTKAQIYTDAIAGFGP